VEGSIRGRGVAVLLARGQGQEQGDGKPGQTRQGA